MCLLSLETCKIVVVSLMSWKLFENYLKWNFIDNKINNTQHLLVKYNYIETKTKTNLIHLKGL